MNSRHSAFNAIWAWAFSIVCVACLLGFGYYLQYVEYLDPCPLCITQRLFYMLVALSAFLAIVAYRYPRIQQVLSGFFIISAVGGLATAGRQVWLQHLPKDEVPECGLGLQHWLENEPFLNTVSLLFKGDGNCAEVQWEFLSLSIGEWSLLWFIEFFVLGVILLVRLGREAKVRKAVVT